MLDLTKLSTSLTKHGAHKIAWLIRDYDPDRILNLLWEEVPGINIEETQARKNLSITATGQIPLVWKKAKAQGSEATNALVLIAIIFSHHQLISAMREAALASFTGRIERGDVLDGKAYTNFAHILEELGYSTQHTKDYVDFDLSRLFKIPGLNSLVLELLALKMKVAGWKGQGDIRELLLKNKFHEVFSAKKGFFEHWLSNRDLDEVIELIEDANYFDGAEDTGEKEFRKYQFKSGHKHKKTGRVTINTRITNKTAILLHNYIQNSFYDRLVKIYGRDSVGCEVPTGKGTLIDVVVETDQFRWFYEIKVAKTLKACIRQAIPQLLEYAYWAEDRNKVDKLIIVSTHAVDVESEAYLTLLRESFGLPLYYERFVEA